MEGPADKVQPHRDQARSDEQDGGKGDKFDQRTILEGEQSQGDGADN